MKRDNLGPAARLADLNRQGFMKRRSLMRWVVAVESVDGDPANATYIEVAAKSKAGALRAAKLRKPGSRLTVRYSL